MAIDNLVGLGTDEGALQFSPCYRPDETIDVDMLGVLETLDSAKRVRTKMSVYALCRASGVRESDNGLDGDDKVRDIAHGRLAVVTPASLGERIAAAGECRTGPRGGGGEQQASKQEHTDAEEQQKVFERGHVVSFYRTTSLEKEFKTSRTNEAAYE